MFVGADPNAGWVAKSVAVDDTGFIVTGSGFAFDAAGRVPLSLETTVPGVFAIRDVRSGSIKRVAAAVGEGAGVVAQIHQVLAADTGRV